MRDRPNFPRMTKTELLLIQTRQKGMEQTIGYFIDVMQYAEPLSIQERRYRRFLAKQKFLKDRGIEGF
ncbi:hypothetical protein ES703_79867 [subsurface metagenome]